MPKKSKLRFDEDGNLLCAAYTRSGALCKAKAVNGSSFCATHGGVTPAAPGQFPAVAPKTKYGAYLPAELLPTYEQVLADNERLSLKHELALIDTQTTSMVRQLTAFDNMPTPSSSLEDRTRYLDARSRFESELNRLIDLRGRTAEREQKRLVALQGVMTVDQAMLLVNAMLTAVQENVTDPELLERIQSSIRDLLYRKKPEEGN